MNPWDEWPTLVFRGQLYAVAPRYIPGVGIREAWDLAVAQGCTLPSVALVQAIYALADCKLDAKAFVLKHDGTFRTMASPLVLSKQAAKVDEAVANWEAMNGPARLVAGTHKDVILDTPKGGKGPKLGLYGWQKRPDGSPIQPPFYGHAGAWKDYSQGARLIKLL